MHYDSAGFEDQFVSWGVPTSIGMDIPKLRTELCVVKEEAVRFVPNGVLNVAPLGDGSEFE
jgi:hypothetical protein